MAFLLDLGKTPKEYGALEEDEKLFLWAAWVHRQNKLIQQQKALERGG